MAIGRHQTLHPQGAAAASSASQFVSLPGLQPRQPQRPHSRHSAADSLHMVPFHFAAVPAFCQPATNPIRLPRTSLSHPKTCQPHRQVSAAAFWANPPSIAPGSGAGPAAVAASPPCLRRRCHCFLPTRPTRKKSRPVKRSGKRTPNAIPIGCRSLGCKPARASLALQPRQPPPARSRRSATVSLHLRSVSLRCCPCLSALPPPTQLFPRPILSHPFKESPHRPTHPFQWCEKQPQSPQAKAPDASSDFLFHWKALASIRRPAAGVVTVISLRMAAFMAAATPALMPNTAKTGCFHGVVAPG